MMKSQDERITCAYLAFTATDFDLMLINALIAYVLLGEKPINLSRLFVLNWEVELQLS